MAEQDCCKDGHDFEIAKRDYFKTNGRPHPLGQCYDQNVSYSMLYCCRCGETKEIVSADHKKPT
jgi:hypothetical protein